MNEIINIIKEYNNQGDNLKLCNSYNFYYLNKITIEKDQDKDYILNNKNKLKWKYLTEIDCSRCNGGIKKFNHLENLKKINLSIYNDKYNNCVVTQEGIENLLNVEELNLFSNERIYDINHMKKIKKLNIGNSELFSSRIRQKGIRKLKNVEEICCYGNFKIKDLNHIKRLKYVDVTYCGVKQEGISKLENIEKIVCVDNRFITDLNHLQKLVYVDIGKFYHGEYCGVEQKGIEKLTNLKEIILIGNSCITNLDHMIHLEKCTIDENNPLKINTNIKNLEIIIKNRYY